MLREETNATNRHPKVIYKIADGKLTDTQIRNAKSKEKAYKISDGKGLYLLIEPNGSKYWRCKYRFNGKEKKLSFGVYPEISLAKAREKRNEARKNLSNNIDPSFAKKLLKNATEELASNSFEAIAREWLATQRPNLDKEYYERIVWEFERDVFPWLGSDPITEIEASKLRTTLKRIEDRGAVETAHRILQRCVRIFSYAISIGKAKHNIAADLRGTLTIPVKSHLAAITNPVEVKGLLLVIDSYKGQFATQRALKLAPLVFVRPIELRTMEWLELDFKDAIWNIPPQKMKMGIKHLVPLSRQAIAILKDIQPLTGNGKYVFPSVNNPNRPMSENTVLGALRRLGYTTDEMTGHGFRSMASTILNEHGWHPDAIERQLAHVEQNNVRAAYNYAQYLPTRIKMMQYWADYLDSLKYDTEFTIYYKRLNIEENID